MDLNLEVELASAGRRLDQFLKDRLPAFSRGRIQKAIRSGLCLLDGQAVPDCNYRLKAGQKILFSLVDEKSELKAEDGELKIIWNDNDLAVCDKSPYLTVHPCPSCPENTLVQRLLSRFPQLAKMGGERPGIVHRLDKDTSGLLLVALSEEARLKLTDAFADRKIAKEYLALVHGLAPEQGQCDLPIGRHPEIRTKMAIVPENRGGKKASSEWRRLWNSKDGAFSLLSIKINTGRTHQIRVHMAHLGHPLLGDKLYAPPRVRDMAQRQMLHAARLGLAHPFSGEILNFYSPPPEDLLSTLIENSKQSFRLVITGNPGCGKSSFARALASLGLPVIDADAIVAELYSSSRDVRDWLIMRGFGLAIAPDSSVRKDELMKIFKERPDIRQDFEKFIHSLVQDRINAFWEENKNALVAVAEVPLFFESGWQKTTGSFLTVGIHCDQKTRHERLRVKRGWDMEKIKTIESWQMPEGEKMALCDFVYDNMSTQEDLGKAASSLLERLKRKQVEEEEKLQRDILKLCAAETPSTQG